MTLDAFAELVGRMRYHQRRYFRTRDREDLAKSKELERKVDDATAEIVSTRHERQGDLFEPEPQHIGRGHFPPLAAKDKPLFGKEV